MTIRLFGLMIIFVVAVAGSACTRLAPSSTSAQKNIVSFLKEYSKKYPHSTLGKGRVEKVEIDRITHLQRGYASAVAFLSIAGGDLYQAAFTFKQEPIGWKIESWELLQ